MSDQTAQPILSVHDLCKHFPIYSQGLLKRQTGNVKAVDHVSFDLTQGKTLGIVGESGCGKTTTGRAILRAINPTSGQVHFRHDGQMVDLAGLSNKQLKPLRRQMQMIFQDPFASLNPRMTVGALVREPLDIYHIGTMKQRTEKVKQILARVGIRPEYSTRYPHAFSGGQRQRIVIARALILQPALIIADEAVSALDVSVQAQVINLLAELKEELNLTMIFIAHDLSVVKHICDEVAVMYAGRIVEKAPTQQLFAAPHHPYTQTLLSAVPNPDPDVPMNLGVTGEVADVGNLPNGCAFHPRCEHCEAICKQTIPAQRHTDNQRLIACHLKPTLDEQSHREHENETANGIQVINQP